MFPVIPVLIPEDPGIDASKDDARYGDTIACKVCFSVACPSDVHILPHQFPPKGWTALELFLISAHCHKVGISPEDLAA